MESAKAFRKFVTPKTFIPPTLIGRVLYVFNAAHRGGGRTVTPAPCPVYTRGQKASAEGWGSDEPCIGAAGTLAVLRKIDPVRT